MAFARYTARLLNQEAFSSNNGSSPFQYYLVPKPVGGKADREDHQQRFWVVFALEQGEGGTVDGYLDHSIGNGSWTAASSSNLAGPGNKVTEMKEATNLAPWIKARVTVGSGATFKGTIWLCSNRPFRLLEGG